MINLSAFPNPGEGSLRRRDLLRIGALGVGGVTLPGLLQSAALDAADASPGFGRARRVMLLYLAGAASQLETFDPKPDAPAEVRGQHGAVPTVLPGVWIDEHLPMVTRRYANLYVHEGSSEAKV